MAKNFKNLLSTLSQLVVDHILTLLYYFDPMKEVIKKINNNSKTIQSSRNKKARKSTTSKIRRQ